MLGGNKHGTFLASCGRGLHSKLGFHKGFLGTTLPPLRLSLDLSIDRGSVEELRDFVSYAS